jgi:IgA peptidase M64
MIKPISMRPRFSQILRQSARFFVFLIGSVGFSPWALGEPVTTIRNNGDSANRVDLVILGDGYTSTEMEKYATDVENAVQGFFAQEPFKEYQRYFNVHRVDVTSAESGADHPEDVPPTSKDTAFDATYNCTGIERLICVDVSKVDTVLGNSVGADQRDMVLVLVNDTEYGGSGGSIAVASLHLAAIELVLHEVGHSFGLLADEYDSGPPPPCDNTIEPPEVNVTRETDRDLIKWNVGGGPPTGWIDPTTPIPTTSTDPGVPGLYEGAKYCPTGLFRPTYNSKMRNLGPPFEQINEEQLVKRIYNFVSPLDSTRPSATNLVLHQGMSRVFKVSVPKPLTHLLKIRWSVDGVVTGKKRRFKLNSAGLSLGDHTIKVTV